MPVRIFIIVLFCIFFQSINANANEFLVEELPISVLEDTTKKKRNFAILPLIFYTPETSLAIGIGGTYSFRFKNEPETSRPSQFITGLSYTLENQILTYLSFQLFKNDEQYKIYGEIGYYRYFFYFYGVGNEEDVLYEEENERYYAYREPYEVNFPRIKLNALREVSPNLYVGLQGWYDNQNFVGIDDTSGMGRLEDGLLTGSKGGVISQLGVVSNYDDRNSVFYPTKGHLIELLATFNSTILGSDFNFQRYAFDAAKYITFKEKHTIALHATGDFIFGDPPFFQIAELGGTKRMRGYFQGRYRDNNALIIQAEYRVPILQNIITSGFFKDRFKVVVFGSLGNVAPTISDFDFSNTRYAYGAGFRFRLTDDGINLRFDYGRTPQGGNFYVTFNEAF